MGGVRVRDAPHAHTSQKQVYFLNLGHQLCPLSIKNPSMCKSMLPSVLICLHFVTFKCSRQMHYSGQQLSYKSKKCQKISPIQNPIEVVGIS